MSNGKGDTPRPLSVDQETFANNWELAFGKQTSARQKFISSSLEDIWSDIETLRKKIEQEELKSEEDSDVSVSSEKNGEN